ncbi:hypothetical protein JB92DRAFT_3118977 [Gautieria morchelliformis]|nr:hypothetical protein JB92DRAFT_3118977 [Gautieria morchelliformis]
MPHLDQLGIECATPVAGHDALQVVGGGDVRGAAGRNEENDNRVVAPSLRVSSLAARTIDLCHKPLHDGERGTNRHRRVKDPSMNLRNSQSLVTLFWQPEGENIPHEPIVDTVQTTHPPPPQQHPPPSSRRPKRSPHHDPGETPAGTHCHLGLNLNDAQPLTPPIMQQPQAVGTSNNHRASTSGPSHQSTTNHARAPDPSASRSQHRGQPQTHGTSHNHQPQRQHQQQPEQQPQQQPQLQPQPDQQQQPQQQLQPPRRNRRQSAPQQTSMRRLQR